MPKRHRAAGRKGGKARAKSTTPEQRHNASAKGGLVCLLTHGTEHFQKMQKVMWDKMPEAAKAERRAKMRELALLRWKKYRDESLRD